ncbi:MAG TPA: four helix bundle protein [Bacteroidales bacterium]|nr:four helix bundle protein [Bacteroidales bacterium]
MSTIKKFEDLEVWKSSRELCKKIKDICDSSSLNKDYSLKNQILSSSGSCMDNIAEGFERDGNKEFINFLYISKGSIGETRSQIHRIFDFSYINSETYNGLLDECLNLSAKISHLITYLHNSDIKGLKKKL